MQMMPSASVVLGAMVVAGCGGSGKLCNLNACTSAASLGWNFTLAKHFNNAKQMVGTGTFNG